MFDQVVEGVCRTAAGQQKLTAADLPGAGLTVAAGPQGVAECDGVSFGPYLLLELDDEGIYHSRNLTCGIDGSKVYSERLAKARDITARQAPGADEGMRFRFWLCRTITAGSQQKHGGNKQVYYPHQVAPPLGSGY